MPTTLKLTIVSFLALTVFATPTHGQMHRGPAPAPASIEVPAGGTSLPMDDIGGRPIVDIRINGKGPYPFVLDTGAHVTVVDTALNNELSLPAAAGVNAAPMSSGQAPAIVAIQEVRVGDAVLRGVIGAVMPLGRLLSGEKAPRGVLSASIFPGYLLTYDYPAKRISIQKGELGKADSQSTFEYAADEALPTVPILVAGHEARVHVDTGAGYGLMLPTKFLDALPLASQPKEAGKARGMAGEFPISKAQVNGPIELGKYKLVLSEVLFSDVRPGGGGPPAGQIGYEVLRHFVVTLDSTNRRIRFVQ